MGDKKMKDVIAYCGLDCESCDARRATLTNDDELRKKTAEEWSRLNGVEIPPEAINCLGCRVDGVKSPYCESICPIRQCALKKNVATCGECAEMETCEKLAPIVKNNESARKNLHVCGKMILETERLSLRPWQESDAENLFKYASNPDVGPIAGWPPHKSIEESLGIIKNVLNGKECYAICLKDDGKAIGAIELKLNGHTDKTDKDDECELGYWLGKPFWGKGIMPEAAKEIIRHAFEDIGMSKIWVGYYEGNEKSKRVQEKCNFRFQHKSENVDVPLMHEKRTSYVSSLTKEEWLLHKLTFRKATSADIDSVCALVDEKAYLDKTSNHERTLVYAISREEWEKIER